MCSNYRPVTSADRLLTYFGVERMGDELPARDVYPQGLAPFIRLADGADPDATPALVAEDGLFGIVPFFKKAELSYGRRCYNSRSETVAKLPSFRSAWKQGKRCIVPAEHIYEPCYETGHAVRWRIGLAGGVPMGIAGIYEDWIADDGTRRFTFAMLTVNADDHPVMKRFHKPGDEKRMVVILDQADYLPWLTCSVAAASEYFRQWDGPLETKPDPQVARGSVGSQPKDPPAPQSGDLFEDQ